MTAPRRTIVLAATVFLVAMCLRPALTSVGPVLPLVGADFALGEAAQGLIGALPLLAFAVVSPLVHRMSTRIGEERTILVALVVLSAAVILRSYGAAPGLWIGTLAIGAAIAVGNVLVPVLVKRDFPDHVSRATGLYSAFLTLAAGTASAMSAPLAAAVDWRFALAVPAVVSIVAGLVWAVRVRRPAPAVPAAPGLAPIAAERSVWRQGSAWLITAYMGLQSTGFYMLVTWLPTIEVSRGISAATAGAHLSVMVWIGIAGSLFIPRLLRAGESHLLGLVLASAPMPVALIGFLLLPQAALLWIALIGLGQGASLTAALTMMTVRARSQSEAARLSGMAQSVGYLVAAVGPVAAGALAEATGDWTWSLILLIAMTGAQVVVGVLLGRARPRGGR